MKPIYFILGIIGIILLFFAASSCSDASRTTKKAETLYETWVAQDSAKFVLLYSQAPQKVIDKFNDYVESDRLLQEEINEERAKKQTKRTEGEKFWSTHKASVIPL